MSTFIMAEELKRASQQILECYIPVEDAQIVADTLVEADLIGVHSHGVAKLPGYIERIEKGLTERKTALKILRENATTTLIDASNGWGQVAAKKAMDIAIEKAKAYGSSFVGVMNSNHFGITSYYTNLAARVNCIGIAMTNTSGLVVPYGSSEPSLGTNPFAVSIPTGKGEYPVVLDMSTSNVARGKIIIAKKEGKKIPSDWAITKDGRRTTDPAEALAGYLLPMGPKGSGMGIVVDILTGVLTGALFGKDVPRMYEDDLPQNLGHFFGAIDIEAFMDIEEFYQRINERRSQTVKSKPQEGYERVYMPGEIEQSKREESLVRGVALPDEVLRELKLLSQRCKVDI